MTDSLQEASLRQKRDVTFINRLGGGKETFLLRSRGGEDLAMSPIRRSGGVHLGVMLNSAFGSSRKLQAAKLLKKLGLNGVTKLRMLRSATFYGRRTRGLEGVAWLLMEP